MKYKFKDIAFNSTEKKKPVESDKSHYIGLEHLDSQCLTVNRYGSDVAPIGEKLIMKKGDVLFGKRRAYQKKVAIAPFDGIFSAHGFVLRPKENVIDKNFFPFFISSDYFLDKAISISVGSLSPTINWSDLNNQDIPFAQEVSNMSLDSFSNIEQNFEKYEGLIYDGAFSEHITTAEQVGLTGDDIDEETAKNKIYTFFDANKIEEIISNGFIENGNIKSYDFTIRIKNEDNVANISISQKGGHLVFLNYNRDVNVENISHEEAVQKGKDYLNNVGFENMQETYYLSQEGILTINYAYKQEDVVMYPDLVKVKVALDNGEILGVESTGYLNSHRERELKTLGITIEEAKMNLNPDLEILSEGNAVIPTEWKSEIECYEFKGRVQDTDFLVYINLENGREEDILVIVNTPNGTLTI